MAVIKPPPEEEQISNEMPQQQEQAAATPPAQQTEEPFVPEDVQQKVQDFLNEPEPGRQSSTTGGQPVAPIQPYLNKDRKINPICCVFILVAVAVSIVVTVLVLRNKDEKNEKNAIQGPGGATCNLAYSIPFGASQVETMIRDDTRHGGKAPSTLLCSIDSATQGLFYQLKVPRTSSSPSGMRFNVTVCPTNYKNVSRSTQTINDFRGGIKMSVVTGSCYASGKFSTSNSDKPKCIASRVVEDNVLCNPAFSSLSWYATDDVDEYYLYVQPKMRYATGGPIELTVRRALAQVGSDLEGPSINATFGTSVAASGDGFLVVASEPLVDTPAGTRKGQVRFFRRSGNNPTYVEDRSPLQGPADQWLFGYNIDVSHSGKTVVIASSSKLNIYQVTSNLKDLNEEIRLRPVFESVFTSEQVGSVAVSGDGRTVAWNINEVGNVQVFQRKTSGAWLQLGSNITFGILSTEHVYDKAVALSKNGTAIAVAGPSNTARVYEWAGSSWVVKGGRVISDATSVAVTSDGNCVAAGKAGQDSTTVKVWCYSLDGRNTLAQVGQTLYGSNVNFGHSLGFSSRGHILAIGSPWTKASSSRTSIGEVQIFQFNFKTRRWDAHGRLGTGITEDVYGWSIAVSADASTIVAGVPLHEGNGQKDAGMVQVFKISADLACGCDG